MIAEYPRWTKFSTRHIQECDRFNSSFAPYADLSVSGMIGWLDLADDLRLSMLNNNLVLQFSDPFDVTAPETITIIGDQQIDETITNLFKKQRQKHLPQKLSMVPECVIDAIQDPSQFIIAPDESNTDYILSTKLLVTLEGPAIRKVRFEVNKFIRRTADREIKTVELDMTSLQNRLLIINTIHLWDNVYTKNDKERTEGIVIDHILRNAEALQVRCLAIIIDDQFEGLCLFRSMVQKDFVNLPHIKTAYRYPYISNFLMHSLAKLLLEEGISYINFEQDLGIPGLRQHKLDFQPVERLKKFTITPADPSGA